ncbi:MAG: DUF3784 domain-containing protein [Clostridium sp.]|nr:DUF3784 domain-containing protein [Clostridium sp.]
MFGEILIVSLLVLIGIMLSLGKWSFLIAGSNTMSKEFYVYCSFVWTLI